ncbi:hexosaminidase D isoform X2 [Pieris rapae]|uniref:hexosaminidase D isoform X2 n=1 Tax=Pieris rapae TaxID=64459 RepID=UPI001E2808F5|nr:hexosaminidase D isoform X2 [Pieris rapae]
MEKIVHLDFKGAPLKVSYLEKLFHSIKEWGGTGLLIEWEDTFPFTADLECVGSLNNSGGDGMYSHEEVKDIMLCAKANGLEVIQLIQTIAHMEYVLKHPKYCHLKESLPSPAVLCPTKPDSLQLVCNMIDNILNAQPEAKYIHIGADEVWHTAVCHSCQQKAATHKYKVASLFLDHIQAVILYVKQRRPNITILMWDDMLRPMTVETLQAYNLRDLVQPVIWNYSSVEHFQIDRTLWEKYDNLFSNVWVGSAFKGANGSSQMLSRVARYVSNQEAWQREISKRPTGIHFNGVILTGWSRYDHYATLCELLPVALPSLFSCLRIWTQPMDTNETAREVLPEEEWPGIEVARCIHSFVMLRERSYSLLHGDLVATWLNPWQIKMSYTSPVQVESVANASKTILTDLKGLYAETKKQLEQITGKRSTEEWIVAFFDTILKNIEELNRVASLRRQVAASVGPSYS